MLAAPGRAAESLRKNFTVMCFIGEFGLPEIKSAGDACQRGSDWGNEFCQTADDAIDSDSLNEPFSRERKWMN
jgi:hypothetical protein